MIITGLISKGESSIFSILDNLLNIKEISSIIIVESDFENYNKLLKYASVNVKIFYLKPLLTYRVHNIAYARNFLISKIKENNCNLCKYFLMMDSGEENIKIKFDFEKIFSTLRYGMFYTASQNDGYYDIMTLRLIDESINKRNWIFKLSGFWYKILYPFIIYPLQRRKYTKIVMVNSAFGGAFICTIKTLNLVNYDFIPCKYMSDHVPMFYNARLSNDISVYITPFIINGPIKFRISLLKKLLKLNEKLFKNNIFSSI